MDNNEIIESVEEVIKEETDRTDEDLRPTVEEIYEESKTEEVPVVKRKRKKHKEEDLTKNIDTVIENEDKVVSNHEIKQVSVKTHHFVKINSKVNFYLDGTSIEGDNGLIFSIIEEKDDSVIISTKKGLKEISKKFVIFI